MITTPNTQYPKTIFITGSSSGLGRAAAKLFSSKGWRMIASMRNPEKETELVKLAGVVLLQLDITDRRQTTMKAKIVFCAIR